MLKMLNYWLMFKLFVFEKCLVTFVGQRYGILR